MVSLNRCIKCISLIAMMLNITNGAKPKYNCRETNVG